MTDADALFTYERALASRPRDGTEPPAAIAVDRDTLGQLLADSRALREIIAAMPKCEHCDVNRCARAATREEHGGMCEDFNLLYWCDEHGESPQRGGDVYDTDWAALLRKLTP